MCNVSVVGDRFTTVLQNISIQSHCWMDSICGTINGEISSKGMQNGVKNSQDENKMCSYGSTRFVTSCY